MAKSLMTRKQLEEMVRAAERQTPKDLIEDFTWLLDCGRSMGKAKTWVDLAPSLQVMVHPSNPNHVLLFYPRVKHWLDPKWRPSVYAPWWI